MHKLPLPQSPSSPASWISISWTILGCAFCSRNMRRIYRDAQKAVEVETMQALGVDDDLITM